MFETLLSDKRLLFLLFKKSATFTKLNPGQHTKRIDVWKKNHKW